jgi:hypothetical protein
VLHQPPADHFTAFDAVGTIHNSNEFALARNPAQQTQCTSNMLSFRKLTSFDPCSGDWEIQSLRRFYDVMQKEVSLFPIFRFVFFDLQPQFLNRKALFFKQKLPRRV